MIKRSMLTVIPAVLAVSSLFCGNADPVMSSSAEEVFNDSLIKPTGAIAYIRNGTEIRLINPDGSNDRQLWTHKFAIEPMGLFDLAWRPDGKELAFSSGHGAIVSYYHADLYSIRPDGSGFRKITNAPDHTELGRYKKGTVTLTLRNNQYTFQKAQSSTGIFTVYITGAAEPQMVTLPPGGTKTIVFKNVADYGNHAQAIVAMYGNIRWFMPGTDVKAGTNTRAPDMIISGDGVEYFGAFRPTWKSDGSEISYRNGLCLVSRIPRNPPKHEVSFNPLFGGEHPDGACVWDWGPTPATRDKIIYSENTGEKGSAFFMMKEGGEHPGEFITVFSDISYQIPGDMRWLPDGSGILYSMVNLYSDAANIFHFDMASRQTRPVTSLEGAFARRFSISPDGKNVVYEKAKSWEDYETVELWITGVDGSNNRLLVQNGLGPSWSR